MLTIREIVAFWDERPKAPEAVAVPLNELRALVGEVEGLKAEKAKRAARHIRGVFTFVRDLQAKGEIA